jgi:uncharacterized repeat protein (TIGR03803 family)
MLLKASSTRLFMIRLHSRSSAGRRSAALIAAATFGSLNSTAHGGYTLSVLASPGASEGTLILDAAGNLYGTTIAGGPAGDGSVFEINPGTNTLSTLATFNGSNGNLPADGLSVDAAGNLYGTTVHGGSYDHGTVFEVPLGSGSISTLATFNVSNGSDPYDGVIADAAGNLYGATYAGGSANLGTIFKLDSKTKVLSTVATFTGDNGSNPDTVLTTDAFGNLYGTTANGGSNGQGTIFKLAPGSGQVTTLAAFNGADGENPGYENKVVLGTGGNVFTTATFGGQNSYGTVAEAAAGSAIAVQLAAFNGSNGAYPVGGLISDSAGNLFGETYSDSTARFGKVFEIAVGSTTVQVIAAFDGLSLTEPQAGLTIDGAGNLYGTTSEGVFELSSYSRTIYFNSAASSYNAPSWSAYNSGSATATSPAAGDLAVVNNGGTVTYSGAAAVFSNSASPASTVGQGIEVNFGTLNWNTDANQAGTANSLQISSGGYAWVTNVGNFNLGVPLIVGAGGIVNVDGGSLVAPLLQVNGGNVAMSGGTFTVAALNISGGSFNWTAGTIAVTGPAGVTSTGLGDITAGKTLLVTNTLTIPTGSTFNIADGTVSAGNVSGGVLSLSAGRLSTRVLSVQTLSVTGTGQIDVGSNGLDDTDSTSLAALTALAANGYNLAGGGNWNGPAGLVSSTAAADSNHLTAVGVVQNNQGGAPLFTASHPFLGLTPGAGDVLARYTFFGDANLDGQVDGSDYSLIDAGFAADQANPGSATGWYNGDFNYDGTVDGSDYALIDNAFNNQYALAAATAEVAAQPAAVPEPVSLMTVAIVGLFTSAGRRRRH